MEINEKLLLPRYKVLPGSAISRKGLLATAQVGNVQLAAVVHTFIVACTNGVTIRDVALNHHLMQKRDNLCMRSNNVGASSQTTIMLSVVSGKEQVRSQNQVDF